MFALPMGFVELFRSLSLDPFPVIDLYPRVNCGRMAAPYGQEAVACENIEKGFRTWRP